ncbi:hypothetical protein [Altericroceibacterium xinjiangense]|uniref:hypothetical protein n=1 Tax=Altericroceibacterium xinjiangense TaxID=762261 RepID=UPI000F7E49A2|nr:hypothetical protein [Altericroceibacterium xinjiangense]
MRLKPNSGQATTLGFCQNEDDVITRHPGREEVSGVKANAVAAALLAAANPPGVRARAADLSGHGKGFPQTEHHVWFALHNAPSRHDPS